MNNNWFHGESEESQRMLRTFDYLWEFIEEHSENPDDDLERFQELCALINGRKMTKRGALISRRMWERKPSSTIQMLIRNLAAIAPKKEVGE